MYPYPKTIEEAAAVLDKAMPGWEKKIDVTFINMNDTCQCILGQLYGRWWKGIEALFFEEGDYKSGFRDDCLDSDDVFGSKASVDEWKRQIENRKNAPYEEMLWETCDWLSNTSELYMLPENVRRWYNKARDERKAALAAEIAAAKAKLTARERQLLGIKEA